MNNFTYCNTTELVFGRGAEEKTGALAARWADEDKKALIVYGGGSAVKSGLLDRVVASLTAAGLTVATLGGVEPNPKAALVREAAAKVRAEGVSVLVAVGGGSVIDTAKAASAAALYDGDFWDFFTGKAVPQQALPVLAVLTIPAAGSESSIRMVVSEGEEKLGCGCPLVRPKAAVINPELFFTLPQKQVSAGVIDMMSHIMERYFTNTKEVEIGDRLCEGTLLAIIKEAAIVMKEPENYGARANLMWCGNIAHNGTCGVGCEEDWASHFLEHEISAIYNVTHGAGLSVVFPAWMTWMTEHNVDKIAQYAVRVWNVSEADDKKAVALEGIARLKYFFKSIGLPVTFSELGIENPDIDRLADSLHRNKGELVGNYVKLTKEDSKEIYRLAL